MKFAWTWEDAGINKWRMRAQKNEDRAEDYIGAVRAGDICFDLVEREPEPGNFVLYADLYVGGIDTGYGYGRKEYPYDFCDEVGFMWESEELAHLEEAAFKETVENVLSTLITLKDKADSRYSLVEKASEELHVW